MIASVVPIDWLLPVVVRLSPLDEIWNGEFVVDSDLVRCATISSVNALCFCFNDSLIRVPQFGHPVQHAVQGPRVVLSLKQREQRKSPEQNSGLVASRSSYTWKGFLGFLFGMVAMTDGECEGDLFSIDHLSRSMSIK